jgi:hypothetical protein
MFFARTEIPKLARSQIARDTIPLGVTHDIRFGGCERMKGRRLATWTYQTVCGSKLLMGQISMAREPMHML